MAEITLLKAVALAGAWLCVPVAMLAKEVSGVGLCLCLFVAVGLTVFLV